MKKIMQAVVIEWAEESGYGDSGALTYRWAERVLLVFEDGSAEERRRMVGGNLVGRWIEERAEDG